MVAVLFSILTSFALAQTSPTLNNMPVDEGTTTISIKKGEKDKAADKKFEIVDGADEVEGEPANLTKGARESWKKACVDWKQEIKDLNKENQVLTISCGTMQCATTAPETTCKSTGKYKLRVKLE